MIKFVFLFVLVCLNGFASGQDRVQKRFWPNGNLMETITPTSKPDVFEICFFSEEVAGFRYFRGEFVFDSTRCPELNILWDGWKPVGKFETWHDNGRLSSVEHWGPGCWRNGERKDYDEQGRLKYEGTYLEGKLHGWEMEYEDGQLQEKTEYENGKKNGDWWERYASDEIHTGQYADDKKTGKWEVRIRGKLTELREYQNGEQHGDMKIWDEKGNLEKHYQYKNGLKEGRCWYLSLGDTVSGNYVNGLSEGEERRVNEKGILEELKTFQKGILNGPYRHYSEEGRLIWEGQYRDGHRDGLWFEYDEYDGFRLEEVKCFNLGEEKVELERSNFDSAREFKKALLELQNAWKQYETERSGPGEGNKSRPEGDEDLPF